MPLTPTLQGRFTLLIALIILVVGVIFGGAYAAWLWREEKQAATESARASLEAALPAVARSAWNLDRTGIRKTLEGIARLPAVERVWFAVEDAAPFRRVMAPRGEDADTTSSDLTHAVVYTTESGTEHRVGTLHLMVDYPEATERTTVLVAALAGVMLAMLVLIAFAARRVFNTVVTRPLDRIGRYLLREDLLTSAPPLDVEPPEREHVSELGQLQTAINRMVSARRADVAQLRDYRDHLAEKVEDRTQLLKATQNELMQAEKLAALGSLVAGVSHELNTPIGNGLMLASTLSEKAPDVAEKVRGPGISRQELQDFLDETVEASNMITKTLTRARDLVQDFKSVAVDRQSAKRRDFRLNDCVEETVATIRPSLKGSAFRLELDLGADVDMDGYPGAISQVLSNLIDNAIRHGFDGCTAGTVRVAAREADAERVAITVADDGNGMSPTQQRRLFDPFYTTKLGQGGSGLGMAIVHRLIYETLGGDVEVESTPGQGSTITLHLPRVAPAADQTETGVADAGDLFGSQRASVHAHRGLGPDAGREGEDEGNRGANAAEVAAETGETAPNRRAAAGARAWTS
jgi:signal transduction histidine kinase